MNKPNPFNPNSSVTPTLFAGRTEIVLSMLRKLEQIKEGRSSSFVFEGERGIGKTALAKFVKFMSTANKDQFGNLNFLTTYYAVEKGQNFEYVFQTSLNQLTDQLPDNTLERLGKRVGGLFKNGKFSFGAFGANLDIDMSPEEKITKTQHIKDIAVSVFTNIIKGLEESEGSQNGILIVIDEVHNLENLEGVAMLLRNIATTLDVNDMGKVSFLIIGYPDGINKFFEGDPSAKRHFDPIRLGCMPLEEAKEVLIKGFKDINVTYDDSELNHFIGFTAGYPHSIQVLGHNLIEVDTDGKITIDDWNKAIARTTIELTTKDFSSLYKFDKKPTAKELLMDILAVISKPAQRNLLESLSLDTNLSRTINELKKVGSIKEDSQTGEISLNSALLNMAILLHLIPKFQTEDYLLKIREDYNTSLLFQDALSAEKK